MKPAACIALLSLLLAASAPLFAQSVEVDDSNEAPANVQQAPATGKAAAQGYMKVRKLPANRAPDTEGDTPRYLALMVGTFFTHQNYNWGDDKNQAPFNFGVTYRVGEWVNSLDLAVRLEYTDYEFNQGRAQKLSIGPILTFPDARSRFPLYFGGGVGAGLFIQQVKDKSPVALDWQVIAGVRFMDVFQNMGFVLETGLKNHVLLTSEGQYNGVFINVGTVWDF